MATLICHKCGSDIPSGSRFCPQCADLVSDADHVEDSQSTTVENIRLVCPKCWKQGVYALDLSEHHDNIKCLYCRSIFASRIVQIRAKTSRGSKKDNTRSFSIRVHLLTGGEDLIEFVNLGYDDFELRSKDRAAFNYFKGNLTIVQNLNVNREMIVSKPACYLASMAYSGDSPEVQTLRSFRDGVLLRHSASVVLVRIYYWVSPCLVRRLARFDCIHCVIRVCLGPFVRLLQERTCSSREATQQHEATLNACRRSWC